MPRSADRSPSPRTVIEVSRKLLEASGEPDDLLRAILDSTVGLFALEGCSLGLVDEEKKRLTFALVAAGADVKEYPLPLGQGVAGWVAEHGESVLQNDVTKDERFFGGVDAETGFATRSILCAPLLREGRVVGVIECLNTKHPDGFTPGDLELLQSFAALATEALVRTRLVARVKNANAVFREADRERYPLVGRESRAFRSVVQTARTAASTAATVLLLGESGTGKEVVARAIHEWSPRAEHPFVPVNCGALSPGLLESEIFGHEKGSFTGAIARKSGKFELAEGGTIFLDEIGDMPADLQAKILRVLQEKEFQRVGGTKDIRVDVRVVAATNRDIVRAVASGAFRADLYYRLNVVSIALPPLRKRREDIPVFAKHFLERFARELKRGTMEFSPAAMALLSSYAWPGNVRELQNVIERAVALGGGPTLGEEDLPDAIRAPAAKPRGGRGGGEPSPAKPSVITDS